MILYLMILWIGNIFLLSAFLNSPTYLKILKIRIFFQSPGEGLPLRGYLPLCLSAVGFSRVLTVPVQGLAACLSCCGCTLFSRVSCYLRRSPLPVKLRGLTRGDTASWWMLWLAYPAVTCSTVITMISSLWQSSYIVPYLYESEICMKIEFV